MPSAQQVLTEAYRELSGLYKNPTRPLGGAAASNLDAELASRHRRLFDLFKHARWGGGKEEPALYFKILALLYEVDYYRGLTPSVQDWITTEATASVEHFDLRRGGRGRRAGADFADPDVRSLWKAKVMCGVAAVESRRRSVHTSALLNELNVLEDFVTENLHRPADALPAWTTLAFVRSAQARVARQGPDYAYVRDKLLNVGQCLDERAAEIIELLSAARARGEGATGEGREVEGLVDDLVFIRQKQTLSILFNVGLADRQRGSLRNANYACHAARFQFRLHGHFLHRLFNEVLLISIRSAQTSQENVAEYRLLKERLERDILPELVPRRDAGNPKLYLYGLRELGVIQLFCGETETTLRTLEAMEGVQTSDPKWQSRISLLHARARYRAWKAMPEGEGNDRLLREALAYSEDAFNRATGLLDGIESYGDAKSLLAAIKHSKSSYVIDAVEGLIAYGTTQLFLRNTREAIKSAEAVIDLCKDDNPRLLAMGHLVMAEAHVETQLFMVARQHLSSAKNLESQIDHKYVADRRRAVERLMSKTLDLTGCENFSEAEERLMGWYIRHYSHMSSAHAIANEIGLSRKTLTNYLRRLDSNSPYADLKEILSRHAKKKRKKRS